MRKSMMKVKAVFPMLSLSVSMVLLHGQSVNTRQSACGYENSVSRQSKQLLITLVPSLKPNHKPQLLDTCWWLLRNLKDLSSAIAPAILLTRGNFACSLPLLFIADLKGLSISVKRLEWVYFQLFYGKPCIVQLSQVSVIVQLSPVSVIDNTVSGISHT
jgi:hypothetical protein